MPIDVSTTGVGFQPKALFLWAIGSNSSLTDILRPSFGFGDGTNNRGIGWDADDNAVANTSRRQSNTHAIANVSGGLGLQFNIKIKTFDADGFTLTYDTNNTGTFDIYYLAIGGTDITNVKAGSITASTSSGNVGYTGVGFQPDMVFFIGANNADDTTSSECVWFIGAAKSSTKRHVMAGASDDTGAATNSSRYQRTDKCIAILTAGAADTVDGEADLVSMDSDGFTLNWSNPVTTGNPVYYLAIKGGSWDLGSFDQPGSTGNQAVTGSGFTPKGVLLESFADVAGSAIVANQRFALGVATGSTARNSIWGGDTDNVNPATSCRGRSTATCIRLVTEAATGTASTINASADFVSNDTNGFTVNWTAVDATARQVLYVAAGDSPAGAALLKQADATEEIGESVSVVLTRVRLVNESEEISESINNAMTKRRVINETEQVGESVMYIRERAYIQPDDILFKLSGGAANTSPNAALGGARSNTTVADNAVNNVWDDVGVAEANAGDTEYRCLYVYNNNPLLTMFSTVIYIGTNTPAPDEAQIGAGTSAINGTEQTVADENTAPIGVSFSTADGEVNGIALGDIPPGQHKAIWIRRVVPASTPIYADDSYSLFITCLSDHT